MDLHSFIHTHLYDSKGRFCSPKLGRPQWYVKNGYQKHLDNILSYSDNLIEGIFIVLHGQIEHKCIICNADTDFLSFTDGYFKTCRTELCKNRSAGTGDYSIQNTPEVCRANSLRMKRHNPMYDRPTVLKKMKTEISRYGELRVCSVESLEASVNTRLERYGGFTPTRIRYKIKDYVMPSGRVVKIQGNEDLALDILLETYCENDVCVGKDVPRVPYFFNNKNRTYYPDIYIASENKIVEVKSTYTYNLGIDVNLVKKQACLDAGYNFEFMILERTK